jgi:UDP-GlcNAc3NAcA epimerase
MKILTIIGARPQFIKAAVVSRAMKKNKYFSEVLVHTGQHYDSNMSAIFFTELEIPVPSYNLAVNDLPGAEMTLQMIEKIHEVIQRESPDCVLVYGDTNSTLAGAVSAKQNGVQLAHVEAGLRSFNMKMPEEFNRVQTDRISDFLFCPTEAAMANLRNEGLEEPKKKIFITGDVMYDASLYYSKISDEKSGILKTIKNNEFILVTIHRAENVDNISILSELCDTLNEISSEITVILPLHPRTKKRMSETGLKFNFETIEPAGYLDMIQLLKNCRLVMTDSGGLQKEAFFFKKHCITLRDQTEWTELVNHGFNVTTGHDKEKILREFKSMMNKKSDFGVRLYGNGKAGEIIVDLLHSAV